MTTQPTQSPNRVAIVGGDLADAALFRGLANYSHLNVNVLESAPESRERGQAIGFNHNAIGALELLGLKRCLDAAGAVRIAPVQLMKARELITGISRILLINSSKTA